MTDDLNMQRETLTIEGDRNLYSFTFTDASGRKLEPEPIVKPDLSTTGSEQSPSHE